MSPSAVMELAREHGREFVAKDPSAKLSEAVLREAFKTRVPQRERTPGDDVIFRATLVATVTKLQAERKVRINP